MFKKLILAVLIIGGINWGLIGLLGFDLVAFIFGSSAALGARIAYIVVGVSALCTTVTTYLLDVSHYEYNH